MSTTTRNTMAGTNKEGIKPEVILDGISYRIDLIVLEELDDEGQPTENYPEYVFGDFLSRMEKEGNQIKGDLVKLILEKILEKEHDQLVEKLQANNQRLASLVAQTESILDSQYLESVSGVNPA